MNGELAGTGTTALGALALRPKKVLSEEPIPSMFDKDEKDGMKSVSVQPVSSEGEVDQSRHINGAASDGNGDIANANEQQQLMTAIYKPESKEAWRDALRLANEKAEQVRGGRFLIGMDRS